MEKMYYQISEVAEMLGVSTSMIRFWEKEFDCIKPAKNKKGNRQFTSDDVQNLRRIYHYTKECGLTLNGAKLQMQKDSSTDELDRLQLIDTLNNLKSFLVELKDTL